MIFRILNARGAALSVEYTIDPSQRVVIVTFAGEVNDADLSKIGADTKSHPLFDPGFSQIVDFSKVTSFNVSTFAVEALARRESIYSSSAKHVVIAPQPYIFGLTRMFQVYAEETRPQMLVVQTLDEAREYLGLQRSTG